MDNLTHSLVGVVLSRAYFKDKAPLATTMLVLAANAPDIDVLISWHGIDYIAWHRNLTHSLLLLPVFMVLVALLWRGLARWRMRDGKSWNRERGTWRAAPETRAMETLGAAAAPPRRRPENPVSWRLGLWAGFLGVGSHLLLDWTNAYGIRLFSPFSGRWFALDWMPIVDPWLWLILGIFLLLPMVLGLVGREIGSHSSRHRFSAILALVALCAWWGFRADMHARALAAIRRDPFPAAAGRSDAAIPTIASPLLWNGIVNLPDRYYQGSVDAPAESWVQAPAVIYKPEATPAILAAERTRIARIFLQFARFPLAGYRRTAHHLTEVWITDLRFSQAGQPSRMGVRIWLTPQLQVRGGRFGFGGGKTRPGR